MTDMFSESTRTATQLPTSTAVAIIGAGPAGLALSSQLSKRRVPHVLLERKSAAASWRSMPAQLRLVSPWWTNVLAKRDVLRHFPFSKVGSEDYAAYITYFMRQQRLVVTEGCNVSEIRRLDANGGFRITTNHGDVEAGLVVCATGYFSRPAQPQPQYEDDGSIPILHAAHFPGPQHAREIARDAPVLVVGRRISAGQIMVELYDNNVPVALSTLSPVEFRRDGIRGAIKDFLYYFYEELLITLRPRLQLPSFPVMDGGRSRELVASGRVAQFAQIRAVRGGSVEFVDGATLRAGLIVNATGYRPALPEFAGFTLSNNVDGLPVCDDWESVDATGLYFLGLDNRVNYRSRTIRGIRRDAAKLACVLATRVHELGSGQPRRGMSSQ